MQEYFSSITSDFAQRFDIAVEDYVTLAGYELKIAPVNAPALLWAHANGFSAGSYLPFLARLSKYFRVFAYDARGHGGSSRPPKPYGATLSFDKFARDLKSVVYTIHNRIGNVPLYFAGHSFSGATMYYLGGHYGFAPWRSVTTFDATILPLNLPKVQNMVTTNRINHYKRAKRRRADWPDIATYKAALSRPGAFDDWTAEMLDAHCKASIRPINDGYTLACLPEIEAAIFAGVRDSRPWQSLTTFPVKARLVAADVNAGGTWVARVQKPAADRLPNAISETMLNAGHLMPMQYPAACAQIVLKMIQ